MGDISTGRSVGAELHLVGSAFLEVLQGIQVARRRLEAAHEAGEAYAAFSQPPGGPIFVNPLHVKYLWQQGKDGAPRESRVANARIHFVDGSSIDVLQGSGVANKRLSEARASLSLFATFAEAGGSQVFVNCTAVTHLTPDSGQAPRSEPATVSGRARSRAT